MSAEDVPTEGNTADGSSALGLARGTRMLVSLAAIAQAEMRKEASVEEGDEIIISEAVRTAVTADVMQTLVQAGIVEERVVMDAAEALVMAELINWDAFEEASIKSVEAPSD